MRPVRSLQLKLTVFEMRTNILNQRPTSLPVTHSNIGGWALKCLCDHHCVHCPSLQSDIELPSLCSHRIVQQWAWFHSVTVYRWHTETYCYDCTFLYDSKTFGQFTETSCCFNHRVVAYEQWLKEVYSGWRLINPKGSCLVHLTTTIHWQPSEHIWRSHYKCSSEFQ